MKKILAILLALTMILTSVAAFAEEAPVGRTITATVNVDAQLLQLLSGGGNELVDIVFSMLNKMSIVAIEDGKGAERLALTANGGNALSFDAAQTEDGIAMVSELFPSYALTLSPQSIGDLLSQSNSSIPLSLGSSGLEGFKAILTALRDKLMTLLKDNRTDLQKGEYVINGKTYTDMAVCDLDGKDIGGILSIFLETLSIALPEQILKSIPDFEELGAGIRYIEYASADRLSTFDEIQVLTDGEIDRKFFFEIQIDEVATRSIQKVAAPVAATLYIPLKLYDTADDAIAALNAGEDKGYAVKLNTLLDFENKFFDVDATLFNAGQFMFGFTLDLSKAGGKLVLTMLTPDMPLVTVDVQVTEGATADITVDTTDLIKLDIINLLNAQTDPDSELMQAFAADIQMGRSMMAVNLIQLLPEEMKALLTLMSPVTQVPPTVETTEEVETVEPPVAPAQ